MIYLAVPGFPAYRVGDDGSVWSRWKPGGKLTAVWRRLKVSPNRSGHLRVCLYRDQRPHFRLVHRLVLEAFVGPCPAGMMSLHRNGKPGDNRLPNLHWGTMRENQEDRIAHGTSNRGEQHGRSRLTVTAVMAIRSRLERGEKAFALAREYEVDPSTISHIKRRELWKHVR